MCLQLLNSLFAHDHTHNTWISDNKGVYLLAGGQYCNTPGSPAVDGECEAGYYCEYGVDTATPAFSASHKGSGGECPMGSYCPKGSVQPLPCAAGYYTNTIRKSDDDVVANHRLI